LHDKQQAEGEDMSDYGLTVAWGDNKVGREAAALDLWGDAMANSEKLKANGRIADYTVQLFGATGGALPAGIMTLWGTQEQIADVQIDEERVRLGQRAALLLNGYCEVRSIRDAAILEGLASYTEIVNSL
jgi:hypothetical protein